MSLSEREEIETTLGDARTIHRTVDTANLAREDDVILFRKQTTSRHEWEQQRENRRAFTSRVDAHG